MFRLVDWFKNLPTWGKVLVIIVFSVFAGTIIFFIGTLVYRNVVSIGTQPVVLPAAQPVTQPTSIFPTSSFPTPEGGPAFVVSAPTPSVSRPGQDQNATGENGIVYVQSEFQWTDIPWTLGVIFWWLVWRVLSWLSWAWIFNGLSKFFRNVHLDSLAEIMDAPWQMVLSIAARDVPGPRLGAGVVVIEIIHMLLVLFVGNPFVWAILIPIIAFAALKLVSMALLALGIPLANILGLPWDRVLPWFFHIVGPRIKGVEKRLKGEKDQKPDRLNEVEKSVCQAEAMARKQLIMSAAAEIRQARGKRRAPARWAVEVLRPASKSKKQRT